MRQLLELIGFDEVGVSIDAVGVDRANIIDLSKADKSKLLFEVRNDNDSLVSDQKVGETQSRIVKKIVNHTGVWLMVDLL